MASDTTPIGAGAIVLDSERRVLLVRLTYGRLNWELPGGARLPGEAVTETAVRELREETGLEAEVERLTGVYYKPASDHHHFVFLCSVIGRLQPSPCSPEVAACGYFAVSDAPRPISSFTMLRISDALVDIPQKLPTTVAELHWLE
jgi:8-oxo-dGTP diphosphatase